MFPQEATQGSGEVKRLMMNLQIFKNSSQSNEINLGPFMHYHKFVI